MAEKMSEPFRAMQQFLRYIVAGGAAFVLDFAALTFGVEQMGLHYLAAATLGFIVGSAVCYTLSVTWVFEERRFESRLQEGTVFVGIGIAALAFNNVAMWFLVDGVGVSYAWAKPVAAGLVMIFNFGVRRVAVFSSGRILLPTDQAAPQGARAR
jgi:putative flippase GtrA